MNVKIAHVEEVDKDKQMEQRYSEAGEIICEQVHFSCNVRRKHIIFFDSIKVKDYLDH